MVVAAWLRVADGFAPPAVREGPAFETRWAASVDADGLTGRGGLNAGPLRRAGADFGGIVVGRGLSGFKMLQRGCECLEARAVLGARPVQVPVPPAPWKTRHHMTFDYVRQLHHYHSFPRCLVPLHMSGRNFVADAVMFKSLFLGDLHANTIGSAVFGLRLHKNIASHIIRTCIHI